MKLFLRFSIFIAAGCVMVFGKAGAGNATDSLNRIISNSKGVEKTETLIKLAGEYEKTGNIAAAEDVLRQALEIVRSETFRSNGNTAMETSIMLNQARLLLFNVSDYYGSLQLLLSVLERASQSGDESIQKKASLFLGFNYRFLARYQESLPFLDQAIALAEREGDTGTMLTAMNEKANNLYYLKQTERAEKLRLEALSIAREKGFREEETFISHDLAIRFVDAGNFRKALEYFLNAYRVNVQNGSSRQTAIVSCNLADAYLNLGKNDSAFFYLSVADSLTRNHKHDYERSLVYDMLGRYYAQTGNYRKAFDYLTKFRALHDSIYNLEKERQIVLISSVYQAEKKDQENKLLRHRQKTLLTITVISGCFIFLIILMLFRNYRKTKSINTEMAKSNEIISRQKENLSQAFDILRQHEKGLEEANASKDIFFSIIAHDLKSPFNALLGFSKILDEEYDTFTATEVKKIIANIHHASDNVYRLLENLLAWSRTQTNRIEINKETFDLAGLISDTLEVLNPQIKGKEITVKFDNRHPVIASSDRFMIEFVVRNLVSNAIKYVQRGGEIRIERIIPGESGLKAEKIQLAVIDNGVGIPEEHLGKLFRIDGSVKTYGTENESGTGLGLIVCHEFIKKLGGELWVKSIPGQGSSFFFTADSA